MGKRMDLSTGFHIRTKDEWNPEEEYVRSGSKGAAAVINEGLRRCRDTMELVFRYCEVNELRPSVRDVSESYKARMAGHLPQRVSEPDFFAKFDEFAADCANNNAWSASTRARMKTFRKELAEFNDKLCFSGLDEKILTSFTNDMRGRFCNSTIEKKLEYLRWFLNWASSHNCPVNPTYKSFRPTLKQVRNPVIYLTRNDISRLRIMKLSSPYLSKVRDVFLFCCFSGLRFSDAKNLRKSDIKESHIEVTTIKTMDSVSIELNDVTRGILDKYSRVDIPCGKALPCSSNQAMNKRLKIICRMAGLDDEIRITRFRGSEREDSFFPKWKLISTHTGRRTFIVQALSLGIPPNVVMKWTGHSSYRAMQPYIDIVDSAKAESMAKFNCLLQPTDSKTG